MTVSKARLFVTAPDNTRLPVIDVTDPAFAVPAAPRSPFRCC
jgi:hypothetical protein